MNSTPRDPRGPYRVVDDFEQELADYTGSQFAVAVNSCTNAIFLALTWAAKTTPARTLEIPRRTYIGVLQAALNAGYTPDWLPDHDWQETGSYRLWPTTVIDSARSIKRGMNVGQPDDALVCLSFHSAKQLPIGRGGAITTNNHAAAEWIRAARMDGRPPGSDTVVFPGWHMPMPPDVAARGLDVLSRWNTRHYTPPRLPDENYPDLAVLFSSSQNRAPSNSGPSTPDLTGASPRRS